MTTSVLIPNYQIGPDLFRAIRSAKQRGAEVVVYDDGSRNGDAEMLARVEGITLIANPVNFGQGWNNHCNAILQAFRASTGDIIMLLDGDDEFLPGKVDRIRGLFEANPDVGYIQHLTRLPSGKVFRPDRPKPKNVGAFIRKYHALGWTFSETSGLCFRRDTFARVAQALEWDFPGLSADGRIAMIASSITKSILLQEVWGVYHLDETKENHQRDYERRVDMERFKVYNKFFNTSLSMRQYKIRRFFSADLLRCLIKTKLNAIIHNRSHNRRGGYAARLRVAT